MKQIIVGLIATILPSMAISYEMMSAEVLSDALERVVGHKSIVAADGPITPIPLLYFIVQDGKGKITDITKKDPFLSDGEKYSHSVAYCGLDIILFTPVENKDLYILMDSETTTPQTMTMKLSENDKKPQLHDFKIGDFSSNASVLETTMLKTTLDFDTGYSIKFIRTEATRQESLGNFDSRDEAQAAIDESCDLDRVDDVKLLDNNTGYEIIFMDDVPSIPVHENSTILVID